MKNLLPTILSLMLTAFCCCSDAQTVSPVKFPAEANVKIYVLHGSSASPDLVVYKVSTADSAGANNGLWYFSPLSNTAQKKVYFDSDSSDADLYIKFTNVISNAGWINSGKSSLMN